MSTFSKSLLFQSSFLDILPSNAMLEALTSSLVDALNSNSPLPSNDLARCLAGTLRWKPSKTFSTKFQSTIAEALIIDSLSVDVLLTFVLHRGHPAIHRIAGRAFRALSYSVCQLRGEELCAVSIS